MYTRNIYVRAKSFVVEFARKNSEALCHFVDSRLNIAS